MLTWYRWVFQSGLKIANAFHMLGYMWGKYNSYAHDKRISPLCSCGSIKDYINILPGSIPILSMTMVTKVFLISKHLRAKEFEIIDWLKICTASNNNLVQSQSHGRRYQRNDSI